MHRLILCLSVLILTGPITYVQAQKVAVIAGDLRESDAEWKELYKKAGGHPAPFIPRSEIRIYDLARPDTAPKSLTVGAFACATFHQNGEEIVVASRSVDEKSTVVQFFATDNGKELRTFTIPDLRIGGPPRTRYEPRPSIRLAKVMGTSQFVLLGEDLRMSTAPCAFAVFDTERLLGMAALPSTSSLFATFSTSTVSGDGALIASIATGNHASLQQLSFCTPNDPHRPVTLLTKLPWRDRVFCATQDVIYGLGSKLSILQLPALPALAQATLSPKALKPVKGVADYYMPLALLPRGNGDLLAFNAVTTEGGVCLGPAQMLVIRLKEGDVQLGPKISNRLVQASLSSDGKRVVIVSMDSPQLVVFSLPDLKVTASIPAVLSQPSDVVIE